MAKKRSTKGRSVASQKTQSAGVPYPPDVPRRLVEDEAESTLPPHRRTPTRSPKPRPPTQAQAAFRLGYLGCSIRLFAESLWFDLSLRDYTPPWRRNAVADLSPWVSMLHEAVGILDDSIPPPALEGLKPAINSFEDFSHRAISRYIDGTFDPDAFQGQAAPWLKMSGTLVFWCERALHQDHRLRPILDVGIAFGRFSLDTLRFHEYYGDPTVGWEGILPDIGEMARRSASIPEDVLAQSPLLGLLARIGRHYSRLGHPRALEIYHDRNRAYWSDPDRELTHVDTLGDMDCVQASSVEDDLAGIHDGMWTEDEVPATIIPDGRTPIGPSDVNNTEALVGDRAGRALLESPRWDLRAHKLHYRGKIARVVKRSRDREGKKASNRNVIKILNDFEELGWLEDGRPSIHDNPFVGGPDIDPVEQLREVRKTLNNKMEPGTLQFELDGPDRITWRDDSGQCGGADHIIPRRLM